MELANEIDRCEEQIWAVEERIEVETDRTKRNKWVATLAWLDQDLCALRNFAC
jgi:hypothetical protein